MAQANVQQDLCVCCITGLLSRTLSLRLLCKSNGQVRGLLRWKCTSFLHSRAELGFIKEHGTYLPWDACALKQCLCLLIALDVEFGPQVPQMFPAGLDLLLRANASDMD